MADVRFARPAILLALLCALPAGACAKDRHPEQQNAAVDTLSQSVPTPGAGGDIAPSTPGYHFTDAQGREPLSLRVQPGRRVSAVMYDTAAMSVPIPAARKRANDLAQQLWTKIGSTAKAETVSVAFTDREKNTKDRTTREFFFYAPDLSYPDSL
jgi:hypothetical protein